ncbi:glycosyltransferase family 2 protein [Methylobacterium aquaticum]|uniref:glycosyltransferase family 2 protein n=1 Tax=Methylobacterium aquaticum TaxID=270351 RepID=UPI003D178BC1
MPLLVGNPPISVSDDLFRFVKKHFDSDYYGCQYPDTSNHSDKFEHYLQKGWLEGRNPCGWFDGFEYIINNEDIEARGINPFIHYIGWGFGEGRKIYPAISPKAALYQAFGDSDIDQLEIIRAHIWPEYYKSQLSEFVKHQDVDIVAHYAYAGWRMGLKPNDTYVPSDAAIVGAKKFGVSPLLFDNNTVNLQQKPEIYSEIYNKQEDEPDNKLVINLSEMSKWDAALLTYAIFCASNERSKSTVNFNLEPANDIISCDFSSYESIGDDPYFILATTYDFRDGGWYNISFDLKSDKMLEPYLYINVTDNWTKFFAVRLGRTTADGNISKDIYIPRDTKQLRFDPCDFRANFSITFCRLRPLTFNELWKNLRVIKQSSVIESTGSNIHAALADISEVWLENSNKTGSSYNEWVQRYSTPDDTDIAFLKSKIAQMEVKPLISVIMATYNTPIDILRAAISSVIGQVYDNWELCIADDCSTDPEIRNVLESYVQTDSRIRVEFRRENGNISAATNTAIKMSQGELLAFMDHDDLIYPHSLGVVACIFYKNKDIDFLYSDEDKIDEDGVRSDPHFKSDWNPELFLNQNYVNHLSVIRRSILPSEEPMRLGFEGSQDYDLLLRVIWKLPRYKIAHVPLVLYSWRVFSSSGSFSRTKARRAKIAAMLSLSDHLYREKIAGDVIEPTEEIFRVKRHLPHGDPLISIIIPTKNKHHLVRQAIEGILFKNSYKNFEIIIVDNGSDDEHSLDYFNAISRHPRINILRYDGPFNYSKLNNMAAQISRGDYLLLLNNDIKMINDDWLAEMLSICCLSDVGIVGSKLLYENDTVQHGGVILGLGGVAGHSHKHRHKSDPGYFRRLQLPQDLSAVTAACLLVKKSVFFEVNGFNEEDLTVAFNDVDLCLKVKSIGYRVVFNPFSCLYHLESVSRGNDTDPDKIERFASEIKYMRNRWKDVLIRDEFYNENLTLDAENFAIGWPSRALLREML